MSLESSNMAGGALGTALSLLLLASITQGIQDVKVLHSEKLEAVEGQNVTLPCVIQGRTDLKIASIEWNKNGNTKLVLYNPNHGFNQFWPNVSMQIENTSMGSYLHLPRVAKWDSGLYFCYITTFPLGSISTETELEIKDVRTMCDVESVVEVHNGENVMIPCRAFPDAQYKWTKNKMLVSVNESLELYSVTDADSGVYTLTVNTGSTSLHKDFTITVLTATASLRTDLLIVPPQSNVTEEGLINSTDSGLTTSPTTGLSTIDSNVTWTMNMGTDVTDDNLNSRNVTAGEHMTSLTNYAHISVTSSPVTHTDRYNSTDQAINPAHDSNSSTFSDQSGPSNPSTTLGYGNKTFRSTQEMRNESMGGHPAATSTVSTGNTTVVIEDGDSGGVQSDVLLLALIIVSILVLIAVVGFLYRRKMIKRRIDLPPPFKPPPPPVKYTAARHCEISTQPFPTSRCNSVTELKDMKQMFINI